MVLTLTLRIAACDAAQTEKAMRPSEKLNQIIGKNY